jgi:hypothetical protein
MHRRTRASQLPLPAKRGEGDDSRDGMSLPHEPHSARLLPLLPKGGEGRGEEAAISKNKMRVARNSESNFNCASSVKLGATEMIFIEPLTLTLSPFSGERETIRAV